MIELIGGHIGLRVFRTPKGVMKVVGKWGLETEPNRKDIWIEANYKGLHQEARMLRALSGTGFAPELIEERDNAILIEDLGESEDTTDPMEFRFNASRLLLALREKRIRHGDLTDKNVIIKNNKPIAIDFAQSTFFDEPVSSSYAQRPEPDSVWLWRIVIGRPEKQSERDPSRAIRRWLAIMRGLECGIWKPPAGSYKDKTLLDLGCFQGEFCAMAAAEGMKAHGVDYGGFRSGEDSIAIANERWGKWCTFEKNDIMDVKDFGYDAVLLLSTWPYIVHKYGRTEAQALLERIVYQCGHLIFETQLYGDGPGPEFLKTDEDVQQMLSMYGKVEKLVSILLPDRGTTRTVWKVSKREQMA